MNALLKLLKHPQTGRVVRLVVFTVLGSAAAVPLLSAWEARYPVIGVIVGALEALYRTAVPTQPAPFVSSQSARPTETAPPAPPAPPATG